MSSILFVDDDPEVISSTRRLLYYRHKDWQVQFAQSATQAMDILNHGKVDVIVSDIRMPGIDGIQFLTTAKEKWPQTVRIVLSGHSNYDSSLQASGVVHQFLIKPCPIDEMVTTIEKALLI
jgi:DNA-binding NtrC family response regulator